MTAGLWMLGILALVLILTGLPAWVALLGVALVFATGGMLADAFPLALLSAIPGRLLGLLENDLLQALPLYVLMGALLNHLPLARALFRTGSRSLNATGAGAPLAGLGDARAHRGRERDGHRGADHQYAGSVRRRTRTCRLAPGALCLHCVADVAAS